MIGKRRPSESAAGDMQPLIRKYIDGQISPEEFARLEQALLADAELRKQYLELTEAEATLHHECLVNSWKRKQENAPPVVSRRWQWTLLSAASLALLLFVGVLSRPMWNAWLGPPAIVNVDPEPETEPALHTQRFFQPARSEDSPPAAVLTYWNNEEDAFRVGHRFRPGTLEFPAGKVQLEFLSGAVVAISGPAKLQIISKDAATLHQGQASVRVPPRARGFILNTPEAAVVDLGTEFSVDVSDNKSTSVEVLDGEVEVSLLGNDGNTLRSQLLGEAKAVRVQRDGEQNVFADIASEGRSNKVEITTLESELTISDAYVATVLAGNPLIYWRFEDVVDGLVPNEAGPRWPASIIQAPEEPDSLVVDAGIIHFHESQLSRLIAAEEPLTELNNGPYTLEMWIRPDILHHMTIASVTPPGPNPLHSLNVIELCTTNSGLVHEPGAIRFLHRYPPGREIEMGVNIFDHGTTTPGQWQHVVAVRDADALRLYANGQLAREIRCDVQNDDSPYQLYLGQLRRSESTMRQFVGAVDEFALYNRALSADEVRRHFDLATVK